MNGQFLAKKYRKKVFLYPTFHFVTTKHSSGSFEFERTSQSFFQSKDLLLLEEHYSHIGHCCQAENILVFMGI